MDCTKHFEYLDSTITLARIMHVRQKRTLDKLSATSNLHSLRRALVVIKTLSRYTIHPPLLRRQASSAILLVIFFATEYAAVCYILNLNNALASRYHTLLSYCTATHLKLRLSNLLRNTSEQYEDVPQIKGMRPQNEFHRQFTRTKRVQQDHSAFNTSPWSIFYTYLANTHREEYDLADSFNIIRWSRISITVCICVVIPLQSRTFRLTVDDF